MVDKITLSSQTIDDLMHDCLTEDSDGLTVEGVVNNYVLDKKALETHREDLKALAAQLPLEFHMSTGGGWSFRNLCMNREGVQWTSFHHVQEALCVLLIGLDVAEWVLPREMWQILPGGMPYFVIKD
jgi:hypothetical protein